MENEFIDPNEYDEAIKEFIRAGILKGLADVQAGRVKELNEDLIIELKEKLRTRLANRKLINN